MPKVQTREEILKAIRSAAIDNGGKPLGRVRFIERTGITEYAITQHWPRYSDALREAGFQPNALNRALNDDDVLARFVELAEKLGHVPTSNELRHARATDPTFPSRGVFDRLGSKQDRIARALAYCRATSSHTAVAALLEAAYADEADRGEGDLARAAEESAPGFVYLARGHPGEYKIGRTNLVDRRLLSSGRCPRSRPSWSTRSRPTIP